MSIPKASYICSWIEVHVNDAAVCDTFMLVDSSFKPIFGDICAGVNYTLLSHLREILEFGFNEMSFNTSKVDAFD